MFQKLRAIRSVTKTTLTRLDVPRNPTETNYKSCSQWISLDTPEAIKSKLIRRNQQHFGQAQGTFPMIPPFSKWIDWSASSHIADLILQGQFTSNEIDGSTQDLINHLKARTTLNNIPDILTKSEWTQKTRNWLELTTTSPSGYHLGHSKVLLAEHNLQPETLKYELLEENYNRLIEWQVDLINLAIQNSYTYVQWSKVINIMILKEPNNYKIHRL